jgi:hypothetical protein
MYSEILSQAARRDTIMLAELAAANAAFNIIKTAIQNGREIHDTGSAAFDYFNNKSKLQKKFEKKGKKTDLEEFFALEKIKEQEEHLKQVMVYSGRPGLWEDWLQFQADAKKERDRQELLRKRKALQRQEAIKLAAGVAIILAGGMALLFGVLMYMMT